ncbi:MAG: hypothetical protein IKQ35_05945 [Bacilli bacterium]|nr:hypothetical protein [Bacilli bacterium]
MKKKTKKETEKEQRIKNYVVGAIYLLIIIFMIVIVRINDSKIQENPVKEDNLTKNNYYYTYKLTINDDTYIYEGKKFNDKESFRVTKDKEENDYYIYKDIALIKKDNDYVLTKKPYFYIDYFNINEINKIINMSEYDKKDKIYKLSTTNFALAYDIEVNDKSLNTIKIKYKDNHISKVTIDYTNYAIARGEAARKVIVELEYKDYGKVKDFDIK